VGDEHHGEPLRLDAVDALREVLDGLWCEHRRRFIEHEQPAAFPDRLGDLDLLLLAETEVGREGVRVDLRAEELRELVEALLRPLLLEHQTGLAEHEVLENGERGHQGGVLVHHADAVVDRRLRRGDRRGHAVDRDRAGIGLLHARENADQGRLAGAVLAQQAVHLTAHDVEGDAVVGHDAGEGLRDVAERDHVGRGRCCQEGLLGVGSGSVPNRIARHRVLSSVRVRHPWRR
jgi:hypothetical protein